MQLRIKQQKQVIVFYFICFAVSYAWYFFHGLLLHQLKPILFITRLDFTLNLLIWTGFPKFVLSHFASLLLMDLGFLAASILLLSSVIKQWRYTSLIAVATSMFSLVYSLIYSSVSFISIEGLLPWILLPLIFSSRTERGFYYFLHSVRLVFAITFASAALWKIVGGGIFNISQMSAILLRQHAFYLTGGEDSLYSTVIRYLIGHSHTSYILYLLGFLIELSFCLALFTRKYDRILIALFVLFVVFDYLLMGISYIGWLSFLGCFYFSCYTPAPSHLNKSKDGVHNIESRQ